MTTTDTRPFGGMRKLDDLVRETKMAPHSDHFDRLGFVDGCPVCDRIMAQRVARIAAVRTRETDRLMRQAPGPR